MAAPKGNQYWKFATNIGRPKIFKTPQDLWDKAVEYFEWANANPWHRHEPVKAGPEFGKTVTAPIERPLSYEGFCLFADIDENTWDRYCKDKKYKEFWAVASKIRRTIDNQQLEGAMVGAFNSQVAMRKLGLKERVDHTTNNKEIELPAIQLKLKNDNT